MRFLFLSAVILAGRAAAPWQDTLSAAGVSIEGSRGGSGLGELPVSLDRIRELLAQPAPLQQSLLKRPTFKVEVEERQHIQELLATLEFDKTKPSPMPPGGRYGYETQRVMLSSITSPLMQPYAAFTAGE